MKAQESRPEGPVKPSVADGRKYGEWTVLGVAAKRSPSGETYWWCQCRCGTERAVSARELRRGNSRSCGCLRGGVSVERGKEYGDWFVLDRDYSRPRGKNGAYWLCECSCGHIKSVLGSSLRKGESSSCGCARTPDLAGEAFGDYIVLRMYEGRSRGGGILWVCECKCGRLNNISASSLTRKDKPVRRCNACARTKHGWAGTPEYRMWCSARQRARDQGVPLDIEPSDIKIPARCPVLGIELRVNKGGTVNDASPTLDKIIPERGYVRGNIVVMSWRANRIKNDGTAEEHKSIYEYLTGVLHTGWDPRFLRGKTRTNLIPGLVPEEEAA